MSALETEIRTYNERLADLIEDAGRFVLIKEAEVVGIYDTYSEALAAGYERFADGVFMVKKIAPAENIAHFTRDLAFECL